MKNILIADDDSMVRSSLSRYFRTKGYYVENALSGSDAIDKVASGEFDIVLLDVLLPDIHGVDVLKEILNISPKTKVIMITAFASIESAIASIKKGATYYLSKPFDMDELDRVVRQALEESRIYINKPHLSLDYVLSCLSNPIRRDIIKLLHRGRAMGLMQITRDLQIDDHTKVSFHLRHLKQSGLISKHPKRTYYLTKDGLNTFDILLSFEKSMS